MNCGKMNEATNYCNWDCHIVDAKKVEGVEICPNGLPIKCIKADGTMMEHEHADHPTYKFPVTIEYRGIIPENLEEHDRYDYYPQVHALIYEDGYIAVTLYECIYYSWYLKDGSWHGGQFSDKDWYMTQESIMKIKHTN